MLRRHGLITPIITIPGDMSSAPAWNYQQHHKRLFRKIQNEKNSATKKLREKFFSAKFWRRKKQEEKNSRREISKTKKRKTKFEKTGKPKFACGDPLAVKDRGPC
jgi:hypothetical protein